MTVAVERNDTHHHRCTLIVHATWSTTRRIVGDYATTTVLQAHNQVAFPLQQSAKHSTAPSLYRSVQQVLCILSRTCTHAVHAATASCASPAKILVSMQRYSLDSSSSVERTGGYHCPAAAAAAYMHCTHSSRSSSNIAPHILDTG
jgi:hypothetical protein